MLSILGYVCFYPSPISVEVFGRILHALLKDQTTLSGYVLSLDGKVDFRKKSIMKSAISSYCAERFAKPFNEAVIRGQLDVGAVSGAGGKVQLQFSPSPHDSTWAIIADSSIPRHFTHPVHSALMGLHSTERYVFLRNIAQYPNVVSIAVECEKADAVSPEQLHAMSEALATALQGIERWASVLDAGAYILTLPTSKSLSAQPDTVDKLDRFFLIPHLSVGGRREIIQSYESDINLHAPTLSLLKTNTADATALTLKNWTDREQLFLSKWHKHMYPNPKPALVPAS